MTFGRIFLHIIYREGVPYADSKQLGVVASVKMMYVLEKNFKWNPKSKRMRFAVHVQIWILDEN